MNKKDLPPTNDYEKTARRPLTYAERKINRTSIKNTMDRLGKELDKSMADIKYDIVHNNGTLPYNLKKKIVEIVTNVQKEAFDFGKQTASSEMKVKVKPTNKKLEGIMTKQNDEVINEMLDQIRKKFAAKGYKTFNDRGSEFSEGGILAQFFNGLKSLFVTGAINLGRETVFESNPERVYAVQYSAIIDDRTTDICLNLDGIVVYMGSKEYYAIRPPRHRGCRSILVVILMEEPVKPSLTPKNRIPLGGPNPPSIEQIDERNKKQQNIVNNSQ